MGKGDRRSRRGKIVRGTHGKTRPKHRHHVMHHAVEATAPKRRGRRSE